MSQWVPSPKVASPSVELGRNKDSRFYRVADSSEPTGLQQDPVSEGSRGLIKAPLWSLLSPFFLSAAFYLSAIFSIFSPLPILLLGVQKGKKWAWLAASVNAVIVALMAQGLGVLYYLVFVVVLSLVFIECYKKVRSIEKIAGIILLAMFISSVLCVMGYSHFFHAHPIQELKFRISEFVEYFAKTSTHPNAFLGNSTDLEEWKRNILLEFPSAIGISALILVWVNLTLLIKLNPGGIRESLALDIDFGKKWKAPDHLVWPTLFSGAFLIGDFGLATDVALNVFKFLMAIYAIHGLSILNYFFDYWKIRGLLKWIGFSFSLFLMMPLILSLGFFDLWFDIRSKFRQS